MTRQFRQGIFQFSLLCPLNSIPYCDIATGGCDIESHNYGSDESDDFIDDGDQSWSDTTLKYWCSDTDSNASIISE